MTQGQDKDKKQALPVIARRKLTISGGSIMVAVPPEWLKQYSLNVGDEVLMVANGSLKIMPESKELVEKLHHILKEGKLGKDE